MSKLYVHRLTEFRQEDAIGIGKLLPSLSSSFTDQPISESLLRKVIDSPYHEQIVARLDGVIVGIATLTVTIGMGAGQKAYLEDFVVSTDTQGQGVGGAVWNEISDWCRERGLKLHFTSRAKREAAHQFYLKHGAHVYETIVFHYTPDQKSD